LTPPLDALGQHLLVELYNCPSDRLNDAPFLERTLEDAARDAGATVVISSFYPFSPHGVSGVVVITESHLAIHTWPERGYAAVDVFTCGHTVEPHAIAQAIVKALGAERHEIISQPRGAVEKL
jgi:S-adenosylmethionine decarboxylase proenzyme